MSDDAFRQDLEELRYELYRRLDRLEADLTRLERTVAVHLREHGA